MTNIAWLKQEWKVKIDALSTDDLYELLTSGRINGGICKYCTPLFEPCDETLENESVCRQRFKIMCGMEHNETMKKLNDFV